MTVRTSPNHFLYAMRRKQHDTHDLWRECEGNSVYFDYDWMGEDYACTTTTDDGYVITVTGTPDYDYLDLDDEGFGTVDEEYQPDIMDHAYTGWQRNDGDVVVSMSGRTYGYVKFLYSDLSLAKRIEYKRKAGMARHDAWLAAREDLRREAEYVHRMMRGDYYRTYMEVTVTYNGQEICNEGIGSGIYFDEGDMVNSTWADYLEPEARHAIKHHRKMQALSRTVPLTPVTPRVEIL